MIVYRSPHIRPINDISRVARMQASPGPGPGESLIPECSGSAACDNDTFPLGIVGCGSQTPGVITFIAAAFLPGGDCSEANTCDVTRAFINGSPVTDPANLTCGIIGDPGPNDCDQGGCYLEFNCTLLVGSGIFCGDITAEVACDNGPRETCVNTAS